MRRLLAVFAGLVCVGSLAGQSAASKSYEAALDAGVTLDPARGFAANQCGSGGGAWSLGARVRRPLGRWFAVEATGQWFLDLMNDVCTEAPLPPPPPVGPYTQRYRIYDSHIIGYPFASTAVRVQLVPLRGAGGELCVWGGIGRLWAKRITVPQAGISAILGHRRIRTLFELDTWWYNVPQHQITENFLDGQLVSRQDLAVRVHERTFVFRAGAVLPLARPRP
jgi:hypothetical protein